MKQDTKTSQMVLLCVCLRGTLKMKLTQWVVSPPGPTKCAWSKYEPQTDFGIKRACGREKWEWGFPGKVPSLRFTHNRLERAPLFTSSQMKVS